MKTTPVRVLIAEDSPVARELLVSILQSTPGLQVVGTARDGSEAVRLAKRLKPDVITMDVHMPDMDGFEATRQIMSETPCPIIIVTDSMNKYKRELTFGALKAGALSVANKPTIHDPPDELEALVTHVKLMSEVKVVRHWNKVGECTGRSQPLTTSAALKQQRKSKVQLIAIASSTGGPGILAEILGRLPANLSVPILIVQHITSGFSEGLAVWLNQKTPLEVRVAKHADEPQAGQVLIAPDNYHMIVNNKGLITLTKDPTRHGLRPAADYLFNSVAQVYGATAIGVILSGMGRDGAEGLQAMRQSGAYTIAQDEVTSVVFGMPAVAIELGAAEQVLPTPQIAATILTLI